MHRGPTLLLAALAAAGASAMQSPAYSRAGNIFSELAARAGLAAPGPATVPNAVLKRSILEELAPFGDPAMRVPASAARSVDDLARQLEARSPTRSPARGGISAIDGRWRVRWSNAPPPSNGALGPFRGEAFQVVDSASRTYSNELSLGGAALTVTLAADFEPSGDASLRVAFRTLTASLAGMKLPPLRFPEGTERTWLLTYSDDDFRIVRAGVDGGRSTARELGLIEAGEGESADAYLFIMTREPKAPAAARGGQRGAAALKSALLAACAGQDLGARSDAARVAEVGRLIDALGAVNPTPEPASSPKLEGTWDIVWTTEAELLFLTSRGLLGLPCTGASQTIAPCRGGGGAEPGAAGCELENAIEFGADGYLRVGSSFEPAPSGGRVDFRFESCEAKWRGLAAPLPPVGSGWFDVVYLDDEIRCCRDVRGDMQVCRRRQV